MGRGIFRLGWMAALAPAILLMGTFSAAAQDAVTVSEQPSAPAESSVPADVTAPDPAPAAADPAPAAPDPAAAAAATTSPAEASAPDGASAPAAAEDTAAATEEEEEERTRRFYVEASGGYTWVNLAQIREDNLLPEPEVVSTTGPAVGGGAGIFWHALTLGVQAELSFHDVFNLGTLAFDIGFRIPTPHVEPYFRLGFGYAWMWAIDSVTLGFNETIPTIHGIVFDIGLGFDFMITELIAIGVGVDAAGFSLRRQAQGLTDAIPDIEETEPGDALGYQISALAQLSLHF